MHPATAVVVTYQRRGGRGYVRNVGEHVAVAHDCQDSTGADSAHDSSKALLVLKQHVYEETVEFHVGCEALQSRLLSLWSRDAASSAPTEVFEILL